MSINTKVIPEPGCGSDRMDFEAEDMTDVWGETWSEDDRVGLGPSPTAPRAWLDPLPCDDARSAMTERQAMIVAAIHGLASLRGRPPSRRELAVVVGIKSLNGVAIHVHALVRKGYLRCPEGRAARDLVLIPPPGKEVR